MVIKLGAPVSESSTGSKQLMPPLILNTFYKTGIENLLPIEFNLAHITTPLCSTTNGQ